MKLCDIFATLSEIVSGLSFCALDIYFRIGDLSFWVIRLYFRFTPPQWKYGIPPPVEIWTPPVETWKIFFLTPPVENDRLIRVDTHSRNKETK